MASDKVSDSKENIVKRIPIPAIPTILIEFLEEAHPSLRPQDDWSDRKLWTEVGKRRLVEWLRVLHDRQRE